MPSGETPTRDCTVGVDVGGTTIKAVLVDASGRALQTRRAATPAPGPATDRATGTGTGTGTDSVTDIVETIATLVKQLTEEGQCQVTGLGVAVPGVVDEERGLAVWSENLRWRDVPLRDLVAQRTVMPVVLGHDVRVGGLAEVRFGAARGARNAVFMPVGTGIAAALVLDGRIYRGGGFAGEIGHVSTGRTDLCACGGRGCLETLASAAAIARRYADRSGRPVSGAAEVLERLEHGDRDAASVWEDALDLLAWGITVLTGVVAPEVVVLGGGLAEAGERFLAPVRSRVESLLTFQPRPRIVAAELGDLAGCLGAARHAKDRLEPAW